MSYQHPSLSRCHVCAHEMPWAGTTPGEYPAWCPPCRATTKHTVRAASAPAETQKITKPEPVSQSIPEFMSSGLHPAPTLAVRPKTQDSHHPQLDLF